MPTGLATGWQGTYTYLGILHVGHSRVVYSTPSYGKTEYFSTVRAFTTPGPTNEHTTKLVRHPAMAKMPNTLRQGHTDI